MHSNDSSSPPGVKKQLLLEKALKQSQDVKDKIKKCASELSAVTEMVKKEVATGSTLQRLETALAHSEKIEYKVGKCASELHEINEVLAREIDDRYKLHHELEETPQKLDPKGNALSDAQDIAVIANEIVHEATQRTLHDFATGIPNQHFFNDRLEQTIALAKRNDWIFAVVFFSVDRFKEINDTHGHGVGDKILRIVAQRLREQIRTEDIVCRYGDNEFLCLLVNPQSKENIQYIVENILDLFSHLFIIEDFTLTIEPNIGIAVYPGDGSMGHELVANADVAMYQAKKNRSRYLFFDDVEDHSADWNTA